MLVFSDGMSLSLPDGDALFSIFLAFVKRLVFEVDGLGAQVGPAPGQKDTEAVDIVLPG
jgi:hypothetical protein